MISGVKILRIATLAAALLLVPSTDRAAERPPSARPNIVFILADDLGYGDLGSFGQTKILTPNLDRLAAEGMRLTQHYAGNAVCAPSRCVLMTGQHPGHAIVRDNREVKPEGQFPLPGGTVTLARIFQSHGWATGAFGKWGLGPPHSSGDPLHQGFDRFFGYNCQRVAHNYYPTSLWDNASILPLQNPPFSAHQKLPANADPADPDSYARFSGSEYAPDLIADAALRFVRDHHAEPFLLYFPSTIPHLALQVPKDSLAEYDGKFPEEPYTGGHSYLPHRAPRAAYAAMVSRLDRDVGRLLEALRENHLEERTIVIFTSDNGPLYDRLGGTDTDFFESARGLRGRKGSLYEGGIRVPGIVWWPGHVPPGTASDRVTGFEDWLPTLLDLCGLESATPPEIDGISFAPTLLGRGQPERPYLYREFAAYGGQQSVRMGRWKAIRQNLQKFDQPAPTELYDLESDPGETTDLAATQPAITAKLEALMRREHQASREFPIRALDAAAPPRTP